MLLCSDPHKQYAAHKEEIDAAIAGVLDRGRYILGEEVSAFEHEFAQFCGADHAVGVGSGTEALHMALVAVGVGEGDEVVTASHTAVATVAAIEQARATPVLVDIDLTSYTLDPERVELAIGPKTKAIVAVHLYGHAADLDALKRLAVDRGIALVEDCAQAHGATYNGKTVGAIGDIAAFSFYPTKNLGAIGDGGAVVTNDSAYAERCRELREYGWTQRYVSTFSGWNSRLDELQAAILRVKLPHLADDNASRRRIAALYDSQLSDCTVIRPVLSEACVYHLYVLRSLRRDELQAFLRDRSILGLVHYPVPIHLQPAYMRGNVRLPGPLLNSERSASEVLSLPMYPELREEDAHRVTGAIREFEGSGT